MFKQRPKKIFPPGTFIPTPARLCAIIQLCIAFSLILWDLSEPFTRELFRQKSLSLLYEEVMGMGSASDHLEHLKRNAMRFETLPSAKKMQLIEEYQSINAEKQRSFISKVQVGLQHFFFRSTPFRLGWLFFSILLPILLLKKKEGSSQAIWLLPLLTFCYALDNQMYGISLHRHEHALFPSEQRLVSKYFESALSKNIFEQHRQLKEGWQRYLVHEWTKDPPATEPSAFKAQVEEGEFAFTLARIEKRQLDAQKEKLVYFQKANASLLFLYLFWNLFFAFIASTYTSQKNLLVKTRFN